MSLDITRIAAPALAARAKELSAAGYRLVQISAVALPVAAMEFQVQFAYPDWKQRLIRLSPVPLLVLLAGLAAAAILGRHPLPAPPPPARLPFRPADATVPTATVLRDRLVPLRSLNRPPSEVISNGMASAMA